MTDLEAPSTLEKASPQVADARPPREGPRERLDEQGASFVSDADLLAMLLGTGMRGEGVEALAERLVATRSLQELSRMEVDALASLHGVGRAKAARIVAAFELGRRALSPGPAPTRIRSADDVDKLLRARLVHQEVEHFIALSLDARHRVVAEHWLAKGTMTSCAVSVADVFRALVRVAAPNVIFVHNHPSGEADPSGDDIALTTRLASAGELLGIRVLDHIILAREGRVSLDESGMLSRVRSGSNTKPFE
jgi:DNA repair protein RadC